MWSVRLDRLLAGTAVALLLPLTLVLVASAQDARPPAAEVEAAVPAPQAPEAAVPTPQPPEAAVPVPQAPEAVVIKETEAPRPVSANAPVADKLRDLASGKFDRLIGNRKDRESIESFYKARDYAPLWIDNGAIGERGQAAVRYLAGVAADGLEPSDYPAPTIKAGAEADALADAEIRLTDSVLDFARHAQTGRVHYTRISADIAFNLERTEPADVLARLADAKDVAAVLDGFNPLHPGYKALKVALAEARKATPAVDKPEVAQIAGGPILRPGMRDERVIAVRKRLGIAHDSDSPVYDDTVFQAVKAFQRDQGIAVDGMLGPGTLRAMNGQQQRRPADVTATVIANLERWRWLPRDLGKTYVMVNVPDFTLRVVHDHKLVWSTKIVVGKPGLKTPLTSASMKYITVNPTWNVPPSIIRNEYLPVIERDPTALERTGLKMEQNPDGTIRIFQPPGDRNALGRIRFNFPNKFLVYQHDTPEKHLFARDTRAYSHGCMRVQDPLKYGEVLLSLVLPGQRYTQERLRGMFGGSEININFPTPIPVHLTYQTAFVDDAGKLVIRDDIYGWDAAVLSWLKDGQRRVAEFAIERPKSTSSLPVMMPAGLMSGRRDSAPTFFERLFGLAPEPVAEPPRRSQRRRSVSDGGRSFN